MSSSEVEADTMDMQKRFYTIMVFAGFFLTSLWNFPTILLASPTSGVLPEQQITAKASVNAAVNLQVQQLSSRLPLYFIPNKGQKDVRVKFYGRQGDSSFFFTSQGIVLSLGTHKTGTGQAPVVTQLTPLGMQPQVGPTPLDPLEGKVNYFIGNDPKKWRTNIPTYRTVLYREAYPGVDLKFYGNGCQLEYDVIVKPGGDPCQVKFHYQGIQNLQLTPEGHLAVTLPDGRQLEHRKPLVFQEIGGQRLTRQGRFEILDQATHTFGFRLATYDKKYALVIDPVLVYSTYLGGGGDDRGQGIAVDNNGNIVVTGYTDSDDFPKVSAYDSIRNATDAFITKYNAAGTAMVFSTYFGGLSLDYGLGVAVDNDRNIYVTGSTKSYNGLNFPLVNAFQETFGNGDYTTGTTDAFVAKFDPTGATLIFSSYLGGNHNDVGQAIAVDQYGAVYVAGDTESTNFPTISGAYQYDNPTAVASTAEKDGFITKISAGIEPYKVYSTYLGGNLEDNCRMIALDQSVSPPQACVAGWTVSSAASFPLKNAKQAVRGSTTSDGFVAKLNGTGSDAIFCTFLGGNSYDEAHGVAVDSSGHVYVSGWTASTDFPTTAGVYQPDKSGSYDAFVTKYLPDGSDYVFCSYLGGTGLEGTSAAGVCFRIAVDSAGLVYVTGFTGSTDFPLKNELYPLTVANDIFLTKFKADGSDLLFSTYLGGNFSDYPQGIAVDQLGNVYLTGYTTSTTDFPLKNPLQPSHAGGTRDAFVIKIDSSVFDLGALYLLLMN
jgi:hypothetical protein